MCNWLPLIPSKLLSLIFNSVYIVHCAAQSNNFLCFCSRKYSYNSHTGKDSYTSHTDLRYPPTKTGTLQNRWAEDWQPAEQGEEREATCRNMIYPRTTNYRVSRLEMANFYRTFSHGGIFGPACWGWGCTASPFHSINTPSTRVTSLSPPSPQLWLARYSYLYFSTLSLSPSLWPELSPSSPLTLSV